MYAFSSIELYSAVKRVADNSQQVFRGSRVQAPDTPESIDYLRGRQDLDDLRSQH